MDAAFQIVSADNVAVALRPLAAGRSAAGVTAASDIAKGHKIAVRPIAAGEQVIKFGFPIGTATRDIAAGEHVHTHNLRTALASSGTYTYQPAARPERAPRDVGFLGYRRPDGRVGTRNEIWIIPTVGCVARTAQKIAERAHRIHAGNGVDGVHAFAHPFGCSQLGDDLAGTAKLLAGLASHPNAGGVLIVGLGCESNQTSKLLEMVDHPNLRTLGAQAAEDEVEEGLALVGELVEQARAEPAPAPLADLVLGVKCGGSDGFSGLTANPLVGRMSDAVTASGGTAILTEIPEIFGAEQLLMERAANEGVFDEIVGLVNGFKRYFTDHGEPVSENPSPGNIAGGITTLEEKSLGAVQKGGQATVTDVLGYGERVRRPGLALLEAPGNDAVSSTALAAAWGDGDPVHHRARDPARLPGADVKIASNHDLALRKPGWIDFDAGDVLDRGMDPVADDCSSWCARSPRDARPQPNATTSARSRSGSAA
jgi:altronate hydrolase